MSSVASDHMIVDTPRGWNRWITSTDLRTSALTTRNNRSCSGVPRSGPWCCFFIRAMRCIAVEMLTQPSRSMLAEHTDSSSSRPRQSMMRWFRSFSSAMHSSGLRELRARSPAKASMSREGEGGERGSHRAPDYALATAPDNALAARPSADLLRRRRARHGGSRPSSRTPAP